METKKFDLDLILTEIGHFGKYQKITFTLLCIPIVLCGSFALSFVFTAGNLDYRCKIAECDQSENATYEVPWFTNAVPHKQSGYSKCTHYKVIKNNTNNGQCTNEDFDKLSDPVRCNEFIYKTDEKTILNEFNITCEENQWKLALVGSTNNMGQLLFMWITGFLSDSFGRKRIVMIGLMGSTIFGVIRSFSTSYWIFICTEFLDAAFAQSIYISIFVLAMEILAPKQRVLGGSITASAYTAGEVYLSVIAKYTRNFRVTLLVMYVPASLLISYYWLIAESMRWLYVKQRYDQVLKIILKIAKTNNCNVPDNLLQPLYDDINANNKNIVQPQDYTSELNESRNVNNNRQILAIFKSSCLVYRLIRCAFCWLVIAFVYYGISLSVVSLAGDKYINFILISLIEIPGFVLCNFLLNRIGRRWSLCVSFFISGAACILAQLFVANAIISLIFCLIGKCSITLSFTAIYIYTAELYPTGVRQTLASMCLTFSRIGTVLAPLTPILANYMPTLPFLLFGGSSILAGLIIIQFPETMNTNLPNTIEEAENVGKK